MGDHSKSASPRLVHCHCVYAKVVPRDVKAEVLKQLAASERDFEALPDLCEMSARKDPALARYAGDPALEIVACFPRAVRWLFHAAGHELHDKTQIHNMREASAQTICNALGVAREES